MSPQDALPRCRFICTLGFLLVRSESHSLNSSSLNNSIYPGEWLLESRASVNGQCRPWSLQLSICPFMFYPWHKIQALWYCPDILQPAHCTLPGCATCSDPRTERWKNLPGLCSAYLRSVQDCSLQSVLQPPSSLVLTIPSDGASFLSLRNLFHSAVHNTGRTCSIQPNGSFFPFHPRCLVTTPWVSLNNSDVFL